MNAFMLKTLALLLGALIAAIENGVGDNIIMLLLGGLRNLVNLLNDEDVSARGNIPSSTLDTMTDNFTELQETMAEYRREQELSSDPLLGEDLF